MLRCHETGTTVFGMNARQHFKEDEKNWLVNPLLRFGMFNAMELLRNVVISAVSCEHAFHNRPRLGANKCPPYGNSVGKVARRTLVSCFGCLPIFV